MRLSSLCLTHIPVAVFLIFLGIRAPSSGVASASPALGWYNLVDDGGYVAGSGRDAAPIFASAFAALSGGGTLFLPRGDFTLDTTVVVPPQVVIVGEGMQNTRVLRGASLATEVFFVPAESESAGFRDITVDGNFQQSIQAGTPVLSAEIGVHGDHCILHRVEIVNYRHMAIEAVGDFAWIDYCRIRGNLGADAASSSVYGVWALVAGSRGLKITHCDMRDLWLGAVFCGGNDLLVDSNTIENTHKQTSPTGGGQIAIANTSVSCIISNNHILAGAGPMASGIEMNASEVVITGNVIFQNLFGVILQDSTVNHSTVVGNDIRGCDVGIEVETGVAHWNLANNSCHENEIGIRIGNGCADFGISGNVCTQNTVGGLVIGSACNRYILSSNRLLGNVTGGYANSSDSAAVKQVGLNLY